MPTNAFAPKYRTSVLALAIAATGGIALPASAQSERAGGLEEILVTAQRREESLQDTPIAITAFTTDRLNDLGVYDVSQVGDFAPNVLIQKQPSSNSNMNIVIRGMSQGETSLLADPKVGFYIDGVFMSKTVGAVFDVVDLERIEVLRGPQGTLFGRNTTGGAVNVTTRKPTGVLGGKAEASVGNFGYMRYGGRLELPAVANIAAQISYNHMETDGWADNDYDGVPQQPATRVEEDLASEDNDSYRIALRWTPVDSLTVDYAYDKTDNEGVPAPFQIVKVHDNLYSYDGDPNNRTPFPFAFLGGSLYQQMAATVGDPDKRREDYTLDAVTTEWLEVEGHTFTAAWEATDSLTLKYIFGDRETDSGYESTDLDGGAYTARDLFYGVFTGQNGPIQVPGFNAAIDKGIIEMQSHEFQIIGNAFDDRLHYTGGLFYYEEETEQDNPQTFSLPIAFIARQGANTPVLGPLYNAAGFCPPELGGAVCVGSQRLPIPGASDPYIAGLTDFRYGQDTESWAAYGQTTYDVTDQFELTLGIRYTEDEKEAFLYNQNIAGFTKDSPIKADDKWDNISYKINGNYAITDDVSVYLTYTTRIQRGRIPDAVRGGGGRDLGTGPEVGVVGQPRALQRRDLHQRLHRHPDRAVRGGNRRRLQQDRERGPGHLRGLRVRYRGSAGRRAHDRHRLRLPRRGIRRVRGAEPGHEPARGHLRQHHRGTDTGALGLAWRAVRLRALQLRCVVGAHGRGLQGRVHLPPVPEHLRLDRRPHAGQRAAQPERDPDGLLREGCTARVAVGQEPDRRGVPELGYRLRFAGLRGQRLR
jgi:iron complex outermembrane receptor protein